MAEKSENIEVKKWSAIKTLKNGRKASVYIRVESSSSGSIEYFEKEADSEPGSWSSISPVPGLLSKSQQEVIDLSLVT